MVCSVYALETECERLTCENEDLRTQIEQGRRNEYKLEHEMEQLRKELSRLEVELHLKNITIGLWNQSEIIKCKAVKIKTQ